MGHACHAGRVVLFNEMRLAAKINHVTGLGRLGFEIETVVLIARQNMRHARVDLDAMLFELCDLLRVVGHQTNRLDLERVKHVSGHGIIAFVITEAKREIRLHGVESLILQTVGADLVGKADTTPLLAQVQHNAHIHFADLLQRSFELVAAIAAQ